MIPVFQAAGSQVCGQACVASIAEVTLDECVRDAFRGRTIGTHTSHVRAALRHYGIKCAPRLRKIGKETKIPDNAILRVQFLGGRAHWLLNWDGKIHDPEDVYPFGYGYHRVVRFLEILP